MKLAEVFDKAADRVERGWCQGQGWILAPTKSQNSLHIVNPEDVISSCMMGAIDLTSPGDYAKAYRFLEDEMAIGFPIGWNDAPERTKEEVVSLLHEAATKAKEIDT